MENTSSRAKDSLIKDLKQQAAKLQLELDEMNRTTYADEPIHVALQKTTANFRTKHDSNGPDYQGFGEYYLFIAVTAGDKTLYIPNSIASGRKSAGIIYQIEGTAGAPSTANITFNGEGITTVTSGIISYCKIPAGSIATFKIIVHVSGRTGKTYKTVVSRINYKLNPNDLRYKKFLLEISSDTLRFR